MPLNCSNPCQGMTVSASELADLTYIEGVDVNGCFRWEAPSHLVCRVFVGLPSGGQAIPASTLLIGNDCQTYTVAPETPNSRTDSSTVTITLSGTLNRNIQADVRVSATAGNQITVNGDGLFVDFTLTDICPALALVPNAGAPAVFGTTRLIGQDCQAYTITETPITPVGTQSINLTINGVQNHTVQADIILDPSPNNLAVIGAPGLLVTETVFTPATTSGIQATPGGTFGHSPSYNVRISATVGNAAVLNADGIFVAPAGGETPITVVDTPSIDLGASGVSNHTLTASVRVSASAGNQLSVLADGLFSSPSPTNFCASISALAPGSPGTPGVSSYVGADCLTHLLPTAGAPETTFNGLTANPGIAIAAGGVAGHSPTFALIISPTAGNVATINGTGLYVPTPLPATACSVGATVATVIGGLDDMLGIDGGGCIVRTTLCNQFNFLSPPVLASDNNYEVLLRGIAAGSSPGCFAAVRPVVRVWDGLITPGEIYLGQSGANGRLDILAPAGGGLITQSFNNISIGSYSVGFVVSPTNGWDTLLLVSSDPTIVNLVAIDNAGTLVQYPKPTAFVETTFAASTINPALTITPGGTAGHQPAFTINVSATAGNQASINGTGIFVPPFSTAPVAAQVDDTAAIAALNGVGGTAGQHATVVVGGLTEMFFHNGTTWIRAY